MSETSTPVNTLTRDNLIMLLRNNVMNNSVEFSDNDVMETDSPVRKQTNLQPVIKKLFHSPASPQSPETIPKNYKLRSRKRKRNILIPDEEEKVTKAYLKERDEYSPDSFGGMRKRVLISLFHNKEYSMDVE